MDIAALILWIVTAAGGSYLLGTWIAKGGPRRQPTGESRFPPGLIFGHFALAAAGLVVWIVYVATDEDAVAWAGFAIVAVVALLGFTMLARWIPTYRTYHGGRASATTAAVTQAGGPAERHFPVAVVGAHGLLAAATLLLVLLAALDIGS